MMPERTVPPTWRIMPFEQCLQRNARGVRACSVQQSDYHEFGDIPVIDQGSKLIAGFTDNVESIYSGQLPVVIFGDHTRVFKYVDFPFASGADGTKILTPANDVDARYFYFALSSLEIPSRGYNRHFKALKEKTIPLPPLPEQHSIATVLTNIQNAITVQKEIIDRTRELKKTLMSKLFTEGLRRETTKETDIGFLPNSWEVVTLEKLLSTDLRNGIYKPSDCYGQGTCKIIELANLYRCERSIDIEPLSFIDVTSTEESRYALKHDDIIVNRVSKQHDGVAQARIVKIPESSETILFESNMLRVRLNNSLVIPDFFSFFSNSHIYSKQVIAKAQKGNQASINQPALNSVLVPLPTIHEQMEITYILSTIENKIEISLEKHGALSALYNTMLHELMTGSIRTTSLMEA